MLFFADLFSFLQNVMQLLERIESIYYLFCSLFCVLSNQENLYMIQHDSELFYEIYNIIKKSCFITSSASSLIMISILSLFERITCFSSLSMEEIKLFAIVNWIFHMWVFLRIFLMPFKYGLVLLRYTSTDKVFFL